MNAAYMVVHQDYGQRMTYPTTVHNVTETLNRHKHDNRKTKNIKNMNTNNPGRNSHNRNSGNENSGESGTNLAQTGGSNGSAGRACYVCGSKEHVAPSCPHKNRPKSQWWKPEKYKDYSALQTENNTNNRSNLQTQSDNTNTSSSTEADHGRSNVQWSFAQFANNMSLGQTRDHDKEGSFIQVGDVDSTLMDDKGDITPYFKDQMERGISADSGSTFRLLKPDLVKDGSNIRRSRFWRTC